MAEGVWQGIQIQTVSKLLLTSKLHSCSDRHFTLCTIMTILKAFVRLASGFAFQPVCLEGIGGGARSRVAMLASAAICTS